MTSRAEDFLALVRKAHRGRIKVYLGSSAGVGKTWRMLQEAQQLQERGVDVVIGFVETHQRSETEAMLAGLERLPTRKVRYQSLELEELDLDGVLSRKPTVVIVDEVPHTNPPGFRNRWRYQDIETLAEAGISVICALNVQHLVSLSEVVWRTTGVRVREQVPDVFLREADSVVNIDLSAEDLIDRLKAGKIYPMERVDHALGSFFQVEHLEALRELALREVAESLDRRQLARQEPGGAGKVMACLGSQSPHATRILDRASRIAGRLNTHWYAVHVKGPISAENERKFHDVLQLAQRLGAEVILLSGEDPVEALLQFARTHGVEHMILGKSLKSRWQELWKESPMIQLIRAASGLDIHLVTG